MGRDAAQTEDGRYRLLVEAVTDYAVWVYILIVHRAHRLAIYGTLQGRPVAVRLAGRGRPSCRASARR